MAKRIIIDSNVYMCDPSCIERFLGCEIYVPLCILEELDKAKKYYDEVARNSQIVIRKLESFTDLEQCDSDQIKQSRVKIDENTWVYFTTDPITDKFDTNIADNKIISLAMILGEDEDVTVISRDVNVRLKCKLFGVQSEDYKREAIVETPSLVYSGLTKVEVEPNKIDQLFNNGNLPFEGKYPNEFFLLKGNAQSAMTRYLSSGVVKPIKEKEMWGISPRNKEQLAAMEILSDPQIDLITLIGKAGGGKTLLALACGLEQTLSVKRYNKLIVTRPVEPMGKDIGYLPGDIEEKMSPWMGAISDNLEVLFNKNLRTLDEYKHKGFIQVEPLTYIRGRSIPKSFIIIDVAQNLSPSQIKTIITRVGEGTKIVLTGDIEQIDCPYFDFSNNGLTHAVEKFKKHSIAGHISLVKGERSNLATLAAEVL